MQHHLALLRIELAGLLAEEPVDVGIAAVDVDAAAHHQLLEPRRRVPERAVAPLDQALELLLRPRLLEARPLQRPQLHPDTRGVQVVDNRLAHVRQRGVAEVIAGVEPAGDYFCDASLTY